MIHRLMVPRSERPRINDLFKWYSLRSKKDCKALGLNGCGSKVTGWAVPELAFHEACEMHDLLYVAGGTARDRRIADAVFLDLMLGALRIYKRRWPIWKRLSLRFSAHAYFWAVRFAGSSSFRFGPRRSVIDLGRILYTERRTTR